MSFSSNGTVQCHIPGRNEAAAEKIKDLGAIEEPEHFIGRPVVQTFPAVRVYVIHHKVDVILRIFFERLSFWDEAAYKLVITFNRAFLPGRMWIAVKDPGAQVLFRVIFDGCRV